MIELDSDAYKRRQIDYRFLIMVRRSMMPLLNCIITLTFTFKILTAGDSFWTHSLFVCTYLDRAFVPFFLLFLFFFSPLFHFLSFYWIPSLLLILNMRLQNGQFMFSHPHWKEHLSSLTFSIIESCWQMFDTCKVESFGAFIRLTEAPPWKKGFDSLKL